MLVKNVDGGQEINGYQVRMALDGTPLGAMHATGIVGRVKQEALSVKSKEVKGVVAAESDLYLKDVKLEQLLP